MWLVQRNKIRVEHAMKILERVIERRVRNVVNIDSMQFGFMAGTSTTDAIFIVPSYRRNIWQGIKNFRYLLLIWRRPIDRVPREVVRSRHCYFWVWMNG